ASRGSRRPSPRPRRRPARGPRTAPRFRHAPPRAHRNPSRRHRRDGSALRPPTRTALSLVSVTPTHPRSPSWHHRNAAPRNGFSGKPVVLPGRHDRPSRRPSRPYPPRPGPITRTTGFLGSAPSSTAPPRHTGGRGQRPAGAAAGTSPAGLRPRCSAASTPSAPAAERRPAAVPPRLREGVGGGGRVPSSAGERRPAGGRGAGRPAEPLTGDRDLLPTATYRTDQSGCDGRRTVEGLLRLRP